MSYIVIVPPRVDSQILDAALYIAEDAPDRALAWYDHVTEKILALGEMPHAYPVSEPDSLLAGYPIRKINLGQYLAFYSINEDSQTVFVEGFRHGARRPPSNP